MQSFSVTVCGQESLPVAGAVSGVITAEGCEVCSGERELRGVIVATGVVVDLVDVCSSQF